MMTAGDDNNENGGVDSSTAANFWVGILGVVVSSLFWGSNFIVCKGYELPKDGIHFAFLMSVGILLVGIATLFSSAKENGDFEAVFSPEGLLGGSLWACGNFLTVPIIEHVGLGIGLALWAGTSLVVAFVVGAIGLESVGLNLPKEPLERPIYGIFGVLFAIAALVLFATIKPKPDANANDNNPTEDGIEIEPQTELETAQQPSEIERNEASEPLLENAQGSAQLGDEDGEEGASQRRREDDDSEAVSGTPKSISLGVSMAIAAGTLYGIQFVPLSMWNAKIIRTGHIFDHPLPSDTIRSLRFFFSQFAGIFLTAFAGFVLYCMYTQNRPKLVPSEATLPSIFCGAMWAIGCAGAMLATSGLGNAVGYPLVLNCSFLVNSAWSILVFGEIQGKKNLKLFGVAFVFNVISSVLISIAKG